VTGAHDQLLLSPPPGEKCDRQQKVANPQSKRNKEVKDSQAARKPAVSSPGRRLPTVAPSGGRGWLRETLPPYLHPSNRSDAF
jgi:hypothetical protein